MDKLKRVNLTPYLFLLPSLTFFIVFAIYPIIDVIRLSFFDITPRGEEIFGGLSNYMRLLDDKVFIWSMKNTILWVVIQISLRIGIGLGIALLLNTPFRGKSIFGVVLILPWAIPIAMTCFAWTWMLNGVYGHLNSVLYALGLISTPFPEWLADPNGAFLWALLSSVYGAITLNTLLFLSGIQSIPSHLYESALIDGASKLQRFRHVTLPLLKPTFIVAFLIGVIGSFGSFSTVWIVTHGGPLHYSEIFVTYLYKVAFEFFDWGRAAAISTIGFIILASFASIYIFRVLREE